MADAVARAIDSGRHLVAQAGTGTGKSLAYLVPVVCSGRKTVVATATKALQDQLATNELPFLARQLGDRTPFVFTVLKGRSNYLCRQRAAEVSGRAPRAGSGGQPGSGQLDALPGMDGGDGGEGDRRAHHVAGGRAGPASSPATFGDEVRALLAWGEVTATGDRSELDFEPQPRAWATVSVGPRECPGAFRCPSGADCFAELARAKAAAADVVVVNTHLYATHVASGGSVLPEHEVLVVDEAHELEDVMANGLGTELTGGRLRALAVTARQLLTGSDTPLVDAVAEAAEQLDAALAPLAGQRILSQQAGRPEPAPLPEVVLRSVLGLTRGRVDSLSSALRRSASAGAEPDPAGIRAQLAAGHISEDLARLASLDADQVAWVEAGAGGTGAPPVLRLAPVDVAPVLAEVVWPGVTAILTSATIPPGVERRVGLPEDRADRVDVGSPFPYREHAVLYVAKHLPDRRSPAAEAAIHDELQALILAAGGRTLALFTSWRAMQAAVDAVRPRLPVVVLAQNDLPKRRLVERFAADEATCLFATLSFWQGIDVPGRTLSLVVIDRLPFPRPDDPLLQARRERAGAEAFRTVDVPRAAVLLAQGAGRLVRSSTDRGVVAVLDRRLATASYRADLLQAMPPMRRSILRHQAEAALADAVSEPGDAPPGRAAPTMPEPHQ